MMEQSSFALQKQKDLQDLAGALQCPEDPEKAERVFRAILHTLRDCLSLDDAIRFLRLLPDSLKTIYIENWHTPASAINWLNPHLLVKAVRDSAGKIAFYDFPTESLTECYIRAVFHYIEKDMSKNKKRVLSAILPFSLISFFEPVSQVTPFTSIYSSIYKGGKNQLSTQVSKIM